MLWEVYRIITVVDIKKKQGFTCCLPSVDADPFFQPDGIYSTFNFLSLSNSSKKPSIVQATRVAVSFKLWSQVLSADAEAEHRAGNAGGDEWLRVSESQRVSGHADPGPDALSCPLPLLQGILAQPIVLRGTINTFTTILCSIRLCTNVCYKQYTIHPLYFYFEVVKLK